MSAGIPAHSRRPGSPRPVSIWLLAGSSSTLLVLSLSSRQKSAAGERTVISDEFPDRQPRQSLNQLFDELNSRWFDGRLRRRKVRWATFRNPHQRGVCPPGPKPILIVRGMSPAGVAAILLHEMCHIGCPSHGRRFTARIARLKDLGAPIPKYEFNYDRRPIGSVVAGYIDRLLAGASMTTST